MFTFEIFISQSRFLKALMVLLSKKFAVMHSAAVMMAWHVMTLETALSAFLVGVCIVLLIILPAAQVAPD